MSRLIKNYIALCFFLLINFSISGQTTYDTLVNYADRSNWGNGELMGHTSGDNTIDTYTINNKTVPKYMYDSNTVTINKMMDSNKVYVVKTFDLNNKIISLALRQGTYFIGLYCEYYESEQIRMKGHYCMLTALERKTLKINDTYVKDKEWSYFDNTGKLTKKEVYIKGKIKK